MFDLLGSLLGTGDFMSHGYCYMWNRSLVRLHFLSDLLIGAAYIAISLTLLRLVQRAKRDIPFHWIILAFGAFIIACGGTHLMEVWTIWTPVYWLSGWVKVVTAAASVTTALVLPPLVPKTLRLIQDAKRSQQHQLQLQATNRELERLYERVKEADRLKTQFFANISHELRTPVALILGPVEKLQAEASLPPKHRHELEVVARNARTLLKHINNLLDLSKLEAGAELLQKSPTNLVNLLRLTAGNFELIAREWGITLAITAPDEILVQADSDKLQRVFLNLLTNAFRFTPAGGRVECRIWSEGEQAVVTVRDTGPGIPEELREAIFERFRQGAETPGRLFGGSGLGLAIARQFVELHGGRISAGNTAEGGAILRVELPLQRTDAPPSTPLKQSARFEELVQLAASDLHPRTTPDRDDSGTTPSNTAEGDTPLVLVVEDNPEMGHFIRDILAKEYRTAAALDGREGLEKALSLRPDLIVCDVMMPRMGGEEMVRELRSRRDFSATPIVMLTAKADDELRLSLLDEYVQDYVTKPVRGAELLARVRNLVKAQQRETALRQSQEELRTLAGRLVSAQEQERARVARDLHDGLNQRLAAVTINIGALQSRLSEPSDLIRQHLGQIEQQMAVIAEEVRWISHQLHPPALEHVGLAPALASHCSDFQTQTGVPTSFVLQNDAPELSAEVASGLFRITQEALQNVAKHAAADDVRVTLRTEGHDVWLSILDNGDGFDTTEAQARRGLGLVSMEERARSLGGSLSLESSRGQGTKVEVHIPLKRA